VTGLFDDLDSNVDKALTRVFLSYADWYMTLRMEEHCETSLAKLEHEGKLFILSLKVFNPVTGPLSEVHITLHNVI
jgi:hypothetical protein